MTRLHSWVKFAISSSIVLTSIAFCPSTARAGIGFQTISPEELKMTSEPKAPGAPAIILFRQVDRDDNGKTSHEDSYFRIKILTNEGRKYADIEIPFMKESQNVVGIKARTIRPDGSISNFDGKVYDKTIVKAKGVKYLAKTFTLPEVQVGSIIEYRYTVDLSEDWIFDSHWILSNELFTKSAKFSLKPYSGEGWSVRWSWHGVALPPKQGPDRIIRLDTSDIPAFQTEDYMPPENEMKSRVDFIYSDDLAEKDAAAFWKKTGKKLNGTLESFVGKHKFFEGVVAQIVSPNDSPEVKAQKLYTRVQQIRNTSYEVQRSDEEKKRDKEKAPSNAEDVWKRGYGDGVQLTWLYLALAKAAGLDAYGVWVADRSNYFLNPNTMESRKLNANVVLIRINGKDVYCDPGAAYTPFGLLPWAETSATGLRLDKDGGSWITTTRPLSSESQTVRKANLKLDLDTGSLEGKLVVTYTGLEASTQRVNERNEDEAAQKKFLEDEVRGSIPVAIEVELLNKPDWKSSSLPLIAEFDLKVPGWAMSAGRRVMLAVGLFGGAEKHVFDHATRVHPVYYEYPTTKLDDVTIDLPEGWRATDLPASHDLDLKAIAFTSKAEVVNGKLHFSRRLSTDIVLMDQKHYSTLQQFYRAVRDNDEQQIVLLPGKVIASK